MRSSSSAKTTRDYDDDMATGNCTRLAGKETYRFVRLLRLPKDGGIPEIMFVLTLRDCKYVSSPKDDGSGPFSPKPLRSLRNKFKMLGLMVSQINRHWCASEK